MIGETKHFVYADDLTLAAQDTSFQTVERKLTSSLQKLTKYHMENHPNQTQKKTQIGM